MCRREAKSRTGGWKKLARGNIGDWRFLRKVEMGEREKGEAVAARAKAKAERVTGTVQGQCFGISTEIECLLYSDFYYTLKGFWILDSGLWILELETRRSWWKGSSATECNG